jgi:hypothetical protein
LIGKLFDGVVMTGRRRLGILWDGHDAGCEAWTSPTKLGGCLLLGCSMSCSGQCM